MPSKGGFQLTEDDKEILKLIHDFRMAQIDQLSALTGRSCKKLHGRLLKLFQHHYLVRIALPLQKHIYLIGTAAQRVLVEQGIEPKEKRLRDYELKEYSLKHTLMITYIHTCLAVASKNSQVKLVAWKQGRDLRDHVEVADGGEYQRVTVEPDAFFTLEDASRPAGRNRANFFLEADRSTSTHQRFQRKIRGYWAYLQNGLHTKKFGIKTFRVVTLTLTPERAQNLCQLAEEVLPTPVRKFFLFGSINQLPLTAPAPILEGMFITPRDFRENTRHPLVPAFTAPPADA